MLTKAQPWSEVDPREWSAWWSRPRSTQTIHQLLHGIFCYGVFLAPPRGVHLTFGGQNRFFDAETAPGSIAFSWLFRVAPSLTAQEIRFFLFYFEMQSCDILVILFQICPSPGFQVSQNGLSRLFSVSAAAPKVDFIASIRTPTPLRRHRLKVSQLVLGG